jgi:hypothetical protein
LAVIVFATGLMLLVYGLFWRPDIASEAKSWALVCTSLAFTIKQIESDLLQRIIYQGTTLSATAKEASTRK